MITIEFIQSTVADYFGFTVEKMQSKSRKHELVIARQIAHYFSKKLTDKSLYEIGFVIGKKNHATAIHSIKTVNNLIDTDKAFRAKIELIYNIFHDPKLINKIELQDKAIDIILKMNIEELKLFIQSHELQTELL